MGCNKAKGCDLLNLCGPSSPLHITSNSALVDCEPMGGGEEGKRKDEVLNRPVFQGSLKVTKRGAAIPEKLSLFYLCQ